MTAVITSLTLNSASSAINTNSSITIYNYNVQNLSTNKFFINPNSNLNLNNLTTTNISSVNTSILNATFTNATFNSFSYSNILPAVVSAITKDSNNILGDTFTGTSNATFTNITGERINITTSNRVSITNCSIGTLSATNCSFSFCSFSVFSSSSLCTIFGTTNTIIGNNLIINNISRSLECITCTNLTSSNSEALKANIILRCESLTIYNGGNSRIDNLSVTNSNFSNVILNNFSANNVSTINATVPSMSSGLCKEITNCSLQNISVATLGTNNILNSATVLVLFSISNISVTNSSYTNLSESAGASTNITITNNIIINNLSASNLSISNLYSNILNVSNLTGRNVNVGTEILSISIPANGLLTSTNIITINTGGGLSDTSSKDNKIICGTFTNQSNTGASVLNENWSITNLLVSNTISFTTGFNYFNVNTISGTHTSVVYLPTNTSILTYTNYSSLTTTNYSSTNMTGVNLTATGNIAGDISITNVTVNNVRTDFINTSSTGIINLTNLVYTSVPMYFDGRGSNTFVANSAIVTRTVIGGVTQSSYITNSATSGTVINTAALIVEGRSLIRGSEIDVFSTKNIKNIIFDESNKELFNEIVNKFEDLKMYRYTFKDKLKYKDCINYGLIAEETKRVFGNYVKNDYQFVPNIYELYKVRKQNNKYIVDNFKYVETMTSDDIKFYDDDNEYICKYELYNDMLILNIDNVNIDNSEIFIYGTYENALSIDKSDIFESSLVYLKYLINKYDSTIEKLQFLEKEFDDYQKSLIL